MDLDGAVLYRLAYGLAAELAEAADPNHPGRHRSTAAAGGTAEAITAEVAHRLAVADEAGRSLVRAAVEDALEGRRPRW